MNKINFTIIIFSFLITNQLKAQTLPLPNENILNSSLDKFIGTWVNVTGKDTMKITLKKENILLPTHQNSREDFIIGYHLYKKGNTTIENSIIFSNSTYYDKHSTILGGNHNNGDTLFCSLKDLSKNKLISLKLIINAAHTQLKWSLANREGLHIGNFDYTFTLPKSLTLLKQ